MPICRHAATRVPSKDKLYHNVTSLLQTLYAGAHPTSTKAPYSHHPLQKPVLTLHALAPPFRVAIDLPDGSSPPKLFPALRHGHVFHWPGFHAEAPSQTGLPCPPPLGLSLLPTPDHSTSFPHIIVFIATTSICKSFAYFLAVSCLYSPPALVHSVCSKENDMTIQRGFKHEIKKQE